MKQTWIKFSAFLFAVALLVPASLLAQDEKEKAEKIEQKEKAEKIEQKEKKERKEEKEKKDVQQIIVTRKGDKDGKVTIEINGDKITVNGKPVDEYKDKDGDISVRLQKFKEMGALARIPWSGSWSGDNNGDGDNDNDNDHDMEYFDVSSNHAMLGVTTEKAEQGVEIQDITKESAAEKAGLKEGDVISKIDDKKMEDPDDLSKIIRDHKPGDKVTVTYFRDKKEQKVTVELTKWKGMESFSFDGMKNFKMDMGNMNLNMPRIQGVPRTRTPFSQNWSWSGGGPKLGLSVQDADDGKGVKVIDVDEEGNAEKAGIKEDDIITEVDGKAVNGADEIAKIIKESKDKISVKVKLQRDGKPMDMEVKIPRKLKTADL
jgi:serine protease Do